MVAWTPLLLSLVLWSTGSNNRRRASRGPASSNHGPQSRKRTEKTSPSSTGRRRYARTGQKRRDVTGNRIGRDGGVASREYSQMQAPDLTKPNGPRPTYLTCRHTYENTLMSELQQIGQQTSDRKIITSSPAPGLVRLEGETDRDPSHDANGFSTFSDPVYALQVLPDCVIVSAESIKGLAKAVQAGLLGPEDPSGSNESKQNIKEEDFRCKPLRAALREAPRASLAVHGLVPGMCKGQKNPVLENRATKIAEELVSMLRRGFPAARKDRRVQELVTTEGAGNHMHDSSSSSDSSASPADLPPRWILQVLLITANVAAASLVRCQHQNGGTLPSAQDGPPSNDQLPSHHYYCWPDWNLPAGLARVDISEVMPSSAYRKLMEALSCMQIRPHRSTTDYVVDLGACPGGWTSVLRRLDCRVVAVDRSPLDPGLMNDPMVEFVKGDAFAYEPPSHKANAGAKEGSANDSVRGTGNVWMVSDVIAYPDRVAELLERWCGGHWATHMIITMKFQGKEPAFPELDHAINIARNHGYHCRAKHFFNNKNEVTLMIQELHGSPRDTSSLPASADNDLLGVAMYHSAILPTAGG